MMRAGPIVAFSACLFVLSACAEGIAPPATTAMATIKADLTFQFGLGENGCGVPSQKQCTDDSLPKFDPGAPKVLMTLKAFEIDVHEVTNAQYRYCVAMNGCSLNAGDNTNNILDYYVNDKYSDHPVVQVTALQAAEYCTFVDKRLPTEFEWERVASGSADSSKTKRIYPFGELGPRQSPVACTDKDVNLYNCRLDDRPRAVSGSKDDVVEVEGTSVWDLFGNVWEWTSSPSHSKASCDNNAPYDCEDCVSCLGNNNKKQCTQKCQSCQCGAGPASTKPNCYKPCDTPICAIYPTTQQPIDPAKIKTPSTDQLVVRGGSFSKGSGQAGIGNLPCQGRSDERSFSWRKAEPHTALGFRCARSL